MRLFVMVEPRFPIPPEQLPAMIEGFVAWRQRHQAKMEAFEFFVAGGGYGIFEAADAAEIHRIFLEYPFTLYSKITVQPTIQGDVALEQFQAALRQMASQQGPR